MLSILYSLNSLDLALFANVSNLKNIWIIGWEIGTFARDIISYKLFMEISMTSVMKFEW